MQIIDNKDYLIREINKEADKAIKEQKASFDKELSDFRKEENKEVKQQLDEIERKTQNMLANLEKQRVNNFELEQNHEISRANKALNDEVWKSLVAKASKNDKILNVIAKELGVLKITSKVHVPKGAKLKGAKADLDEAKVVVEQAKNFEKEMLVSDYLMKHQDIFDKVMN